MIPDKYEGHEALVLSRPGVGRGVLVEDAAGRFLDAGPDRDAQGDAFVGLASVDGVDGVRGFVRVEGRGEFFFLAASDALG